MRLHDTCLRSRLGAQFGKLAAWAVTLGYLIAMPFGARALSGDASDKVVGSALAWLTWLVGSALALSAVSRGTDEVPVRALALSRGFSLRASERAELLAVGRRMLRVVGLPAMLLAVFALSLSRNLQTAVARALLVLGVLGYVLLICVLVVVLVRVARVLGSRRPRSALLALVILPDMLRGLFPSVPSVPALTGFLATELMRIGAHLR